MRVFESVEEANAYNVGFLQGVRQEDMHVDRPWFVGSEQEQQAWSEGVSEGHAMRMQFFGGDKRRKAPLEMADACH